MLSNDILLKGHTARRSFSNSNTNHQACLTAWLLHYLRELVESGSFKTEWGVWYDNPILFRNARAVGMTLTDICYLLECTERSLNIILDLKGEVNGKVTLKMSEEDDINCLHGQKIPKDIRRISDIAMDGSVECILVLEKALFMMLSAKQNSI